MENGICNYQLTTKWQGGMSSRTHSRSCFDEGNLHSRQDHIIDSDEPEALGGTGLAPNPQELILAAFNACMTAAFVYEAHRQDITISHLEIQTSATLCIMRHESTDSKVDERIDYTIHVSGNGNTRQFDKIHSAIIRLSPNRWLIAGNITIEGDLIVT